MNDGGLQTLLAFFAPPTATHRVPPVAVHPAAAQPATIDGIVFERSRRAHSYRLTLRRDGTVVATIPDRKSVV